MTPATEVSAPSRPKQRRRTSLARRDEYVTRYYHCVAKVAKVLLRRLPPSTDLSDLMSAGALGLIEAAGRFDPARGESFEAFARIRIRGAMLDDIRVRDSMSRDMRRTWRAINRSTSVLTQRLGRAPFEQEIAARRELVDRLARDIAALPPRMRQVLSLYYRESLSLREIGLVLGVTECRVCQIHGEATRRLRATRLGDGEA